MEGQADEPINSKAGATGGGVARVSNMSLKRLYGLRAGLHSVGGSAPDKYAFTMAQGGPVACCGFTDRLLEAMRHGDPDPKGRASAKFRPAKGRNEVGVTALMVYNDLFAFARAS
jgi:hypothetical protein